MTTVGELIQDVRREVFGMQRPEYNQLANSISDTDTVVTLTMDAAAASVGSLVSVDDELMYVWDVSGSSLTVRRAMLGTTAAVHTSDDLIEINPLFPDILIRDALRKEILGWAPRLGAIAVAPLSIASGVRDVDLDGIPGDYIEILEVLRSPRANATTWIPVGWRAERNMDVADYPSGSALFLDTEGEIGIDLRVTYLTPYDVTDFSNTAHLDDIGLAPTQHDIAVLGAMWRLVTSREVKRNFVEAQGDPRQATEVPPGAIANSGRLMKALRDERLREEINRLRDVSVPAALMVFSPDFGEAWFSGVATALNVPLTLPVAIGGHAYRVDLDQYQRETVDALRSAYDSLAEPGEHSLNTVGIWRRTQTHWEMGKGQTHWDEKDSDQFRFRESKGLDPWTERTLRLHKDTALSRSGAYSDLKLLSVGTSHLYGVMNQQVYFSTNPYAGSPTWTSSVIHVAEGATSCTSITTDGAAVYAALNANGIHKTTVGASSSSHFSAYTADLVGFANGHLLAADGNVLVEIDSVGASTTLLTHFNPSFSFVSITPSPAGIFVGGNSADRGEFYYVGFNTTSAALAVPIPAGSLPRGEYLRDMKFYAGLLILGTSKGFRLAEIISDRGVSIGPLIVNSSEVSCVDVDGEYAWYGATAFDSSTSGLYRAKLSRFTDNLVPAYCSDLMAASQAGITQSVARFQGKTTFAVAGAGFYAESTTLVASGYLDSGYIRWGTMEQKVAASVGLKHEPLHGTVAVTILTEDGGTYAAGVSQTAATTGPSDEFSGGNTDGETLEVRVVLTRDSGDTTLGPVLRRWTIRAEVIPLLTDAIVVPIIMKTSVLNMVGQGQVVRFDPLEEFLYLKSLEAARVPVLYQEGDLGQQVIVDKVSVKPEMWIEPTHHWFEGLIFVRLLTVQPVG